MASILIEQATSRFIQMTKEAGRSALNALYPTDFEVYLMSLELVKINSSGVEEIINFFSFPVMPNSIRQSEPQITNIKKNVGGITVLNTNTFIPKEISLQGNFGRNFKILLGNDIVDFKGISLNPNSAIKNVGQTLKKKVSDAIDLRPTSFSPYVKTGYGCIKILQAICDSSVEIDNGRPRRLYFHNPTLGESYLVKVTNFTADQNLGSNMIWNYSLQLKAISPTENLRKTEQGSLKNALQKGTIQNGVNSLFSIIKISINK